MYLDRSAALPSPLSRIRDGERADEQTYLAGYFCLIDFCLVAQYAYYRRKARQTITASPLVNGSTYEYASSPHASLVVPRATSSHRRTHSSTTAPSSPNTTVRPLKRPTTYAHYPSSSSSQLLQSAASPPLPKDDYAAIFEAAMDVARAAERAEARRSASRRGRASRQRAADEEHMIDSFHSEMSVRTNASEEARRLSASTGGLDKRGRTLFRREPTTQGPVPEESEDLGALPELRSAMERRSQSRSLSLVRGQSGRGKARRAAGVAFMSLGLIVGGGMLHRQPTAVRSTGIVLLASSNGAPVPHQPTSTHNARWHSQQLLPSHILLTPVLVFNDLPHENHSSPEPVSYQRLIGRISAWTCTTLYLTSRLPQIWKNVRGHFLRRSPAHS